MVINEIASRSVGSPEEHFKHVAEVELPVVVNPHVVNDILDLQLCQSCSADVVRPHEFLLVEHSIICLVDHLKCLQVYPLAPVGYYFWRHQLQELFELDQSVPILVDLFYYLAQLSFAESLAKTLQDLVELLCEDGSTLIEIDPDLSWSNIWKALRAY